MGKPSRHITDLNLDSDEGFYKSLDHRPTDTPATKSTKKDAANSANIDSSSSLDQQTRDQQNLSKPEADSLGINYRSAHDNSSYRNRFKTNRSTWKRYLAGTSAGGAVIGLVFSAITALIPLKFDFIFSAIEQQVATVPQYAIEKRLNFLVGRYINRAVLGAGVSDDVYFGKSLTGTMLGNWRSAKFEETLKDQLGLEIKKSNRGIDGKATEWIVELDGKVMGGGTGNFDLELGDNVINRNRMRNVIRQAAKDTTHWHQFMKRRTMRRILQNKYNVPTWFVDFFGQKTADKADDTRTSYIEKKRKYMSWTTQNGIGRVSKRFGAYLVCLIDGAGGCDSLKKQQGTQDTPEADGGIDESIDSPDAPESDLDKNSSGKLTKKLREFGLRKTIGSAVAGVSLIDFFSDMVTGINEGRLTEVSGLMNGDSGVGSYVSAATTSSQINDGNKVLSEDAQLLHDRLDGFEASPVYGALNGSIDGLGFNGVANAAQEYSQISRNCYEDGEIKVVALPAGELVCQTMKLYNPRLDETIKNTPGFGILVGYADAWNSTGGKIIGAVETLLSNIPILSDAVDAAMTKATEVTGLDDLIGAGTDKVMDLVFNPGCLGNEYGELFFDCIYMGAEVIFNDVAKSGGDYGAGGKALTDEQIAAIFEEVETDRKYAFAQKSFYERLFSSEDHNSLLGQIAMSAPANINQVGQSLTTALANPGQSLAALVSAPIKAQAQPVDFNPFGVIRYGYAVDDPALTLEPNSPVLENCGNNAEDTREYGNIDGIVFPVAISTDACALDRVVANLGSCMFTVTDCGIDPQNPNPLTGGTEFDTLLSFEPPEVVRYNPEDCTAEITAGSIDAANVAIREAQPGAVICLHGGTYNGTVGVFGKNGTQSDWIAITSYPGEQAVIQPVDNCGVLISGGSSYIEVSHLELVGYSKLDSGSDIFVGGAPCGSGFSTGGYGNNNPAHHLRIFNNHVYNFPSNGIGNSSGDNIHIEGNIIHNNAYWYSNQGSAITLFQLTNIGSGTNGGYNNVIKHNIVYQNENKAREHYDGRDPQDRITDGNCIIIDDTNHYNYTGKTLVSQNACFSNGGRSYHVFDSNNVDVLNNTALKNGQTEVRKDNPHNLGMPGVGELTAYRAQNVRFENNLIWPDQGIKANRVGESSNIEFRNNMYVGEQAEGLSEAFGQGDVWFIGNPGLSSSSIDSGVADLSIVIGSEADRAGVGASIWKTTNPNSIDNSDRQGGIR